MKIYVKNFSAIAVSLMMMGTVAMGASAFNDTATNKYNKLYYSGSETKTNYFVTYSKGTNLVSKSKYLYVSSIIMDRSGSVLTSNKSEGVAKTNTSRSCYANLGDSGAYQSYHRSIIKNSTSPTDTTLNVLHRYVRLTENRVL